MLYFQIFKDLNFLFLWFALQAEPEQRKALHKLRCTWTPYVPTRKLAAIDRHVHALDPNWPVQATDDSGPPSPTIFVNPKFLVRYLTGQSILNRFVSV